MMAAEILAAVMARYDDISQQMVIAAGQGSQIAARFLHDAIIARSAY